MRAVTQNPDRSQSGPWTHRVRVARGGGSIFLLFFGVAVAACLTFVAGVLVGKRLEQQTIASGSPAVEEPLAKLDQDQAGESDEKEDFTFLERLARDESQREQTAASSAESNPVPRGRRRRDIHAR